MKRPYDPQGKAALYSGARPDEGLFLVECSSCLDHRRVGLLGLLGLALPLNFTNPFRYHHTWMRCPSCGRRTWLRVRPIR